MSKVYNLDEICKLMKLSIEDVDKNDIDRLDYLVNNLQVMNEEPFDSNEINTIKGETIYNPSQVCGEDTHIGLVEINRVVNLDKFVKNYVLMITKYYI